MMGMRGKKDPLSWHVNPAWNPNTCKDQKGKEMKGEDRGELTRWKNTEEFTNTLGEKKKMIMW